MLTRLLLAPVLALALSLAACDNETPQEKLAEIEALMKKELPMTPKDEGAIKTATDRGRQFLTDGKEQDASKAFDEALVLLEKAEFAKLYANSE